MSETWDERFDEAKRQARMAAAAPELYEALDALYRYCNGDPEMAGMEGYAMNEAKRALAKARGEDDA